MNCGWLSAGGLSAACTFDRQRYFFFEVGLSAAVVLSCGKQHKDAGWPLQQCGSSFGCLLLSTMPIS